MPKDECRKDEVEQMSTELEPVAGQWYQHLDKGQPFVVIDVDDTREIIEIQHYDGDIEELETSAWLDLDLELAEPPEDWTGPVDDVEVDDLDYSETGMSRRDWSRPLDENRPSPRERWEDTDNAQDDLGEGDSAEMLYGDDPDR
jgi:hypothetical protein